MNIPDKQFQLIVKYLDKDLISEERSLFEELLSSSEQFRAELNQSKLIIASIKAIGHEENTIAVKNIIKKDNKFKKTRIDKHLKISSLIGLAASFTSLLFLFFFESHKTLDNSSEAIYHSYFEAFPVFSSFRGPSYSNDALLFYQHGLYEEAIQLLNSEYKKSKKDLKTALYLANAYMVTNQFSEAEIILKEMEITKDYRSLKEYALWFLGLTQLRLNKREEAINQFKKLKSIEGTYNELAIEILKEIDLQCENND